MEANRNARGANLQETNKNNYKRDREEIKRRELRSCEGVNDLECYALHATFGVWWL